MSNVTISGAAEPAPRVTAALDLDALCEAIDQLPEEATAVMIMCAEKSAQLFWRTDSPTWEWRHGGEIAVSALPAGRPPRE